MSQMATIISLPRLPIVNRAWLAVPMTPTFNFSLGDSLALAGRLPKTPQPARADPAKADCLRNSRRVRVDMAGILRESCGWGGPRSRGAGHYTPHATVRRQHPSKR